MNSDRDTRQSFPWAGWVAPFGDPGINDRSHLPRAFRSVPRPSSPLSAKASTRCPYVSPDPNSPPPGRCYPPQRRPSENRRAQGQAPAARPVPPRGDELPPEETSPTTGDPARGLSHEDTSFGPTPRQPAPAPPDKVPQNKQPGPGLVRLGHIHKSIFTLQSTPPPRTRPRRHSQRHRREVAPGGMARRFSERRFQRSKAGSPGSRPRSSAVPHVQSPCAVPMTRRPWWRRHGGGERDRTDDLLLAKQALSQLSYTPLRRSEAGDQTQKLDL